MWNILTSALQGLLSTSVRGGNSHFLTEPTLTLNKVPLRGTRFDLGHSIILRKLPKICEIIWLQFLWNQKKLWLDVLYTYIWNGEILLLGYPKCKNNCFICYLLSNFHITGGLSDVRKLCNKHIPAYKFDFVSPELKQRFEPDQVAKDLDIQYIADKSVFKVSLFSLLRCIHTGDFAKSKSKDSIVLPILWHLLED